MQDEFTPILLDLTWRQDNVIWIVGEQKAAHFPAGRGRTTMIENRSHLVVVGIMMGHSLKKSHRLGLGMNLGPPQPDFNHFLRC